LEFAGRTLLERHIEILRHLGVDGIVMVTGYRADDIHQAIAELGAGDTIETIHNPDFTLGSMISLWTAREALTSGDDIIFMDADVLYDHRLMRPLVETEHANCMLMDREVRPGEDPVKICVRDGVIVDFHKRVKIAHDYWGEWPGFLRISPAIGRRLVEVMGGYMDAGRTMEIYEEAFRDVVITEPAGTFAFADITGLPWGEIDYQADLARANQEVLGELREIETVGEKTA
jgi:choline kinase